MRNAIFFAAATASIMLLAGGNAMAESEDRSMILFKAAHGIAASKEIARSLAEKVIVQVYGEQALSSAEPLEVKDEGNFWTIEGVSTSKESLSSENNVFKNGILQIKILKYNCQIISMKKVVTSR